MGDQQTWFGIKAPERSIRQITVKQNRPVYVEWPNRLFVSLSPLPLDDHQFQGPVCNTVLYARETAFFDGKECER